MINYQKVEFFKKKKYYKEHEEEIDTALRTEISWYKSKGVDPEINEEDI